jgi:hypothetical protein
MRRQIEICASFTGKISTGSFENESPFFSAKEIIEIDEPTGMVDALIETRQNELKDICYAQFKKHAEIAYQEKVAKSYKSIRFYDAGNGQKYPSVTSIINMDANFFTAPEELAQMAARGTIIHKQVEEFLKTGKWLEPKEIPEISFQVMTVVTGSLGLAVDDVNFVNFYREYPFKVIKQESQVINHEHKYAGRMDILCVIESTNKGKWDKIEGVVFDTPTIFDVKTSTTLDKLKAFTQEAAYAKTDDAIKQMVIIHLNKENVSGYGKPAVTGKIEHYWSIFLNHREKFKTRYGI